MPIKTLIDLKNKKAKLDQEIFIFDRKNKEITDQIEALENKIEHLQKQKKEKKFHLFSNFNKKITKLVIKIKDLKEELVENQKNIQPLKVLKLNILKNIIDSQNNLYKEQMKKYQEIFQKLDAISANQKFKVVDESRMSLAKNPFDENDNETEKFNNLIPQINELDDQILTFEKENEEIVLQIETFENNIVDLREQKAEKSWQITFLNIITCGIFKYHKNKKINKQIKKLKIKIRTLSEELTKNEKNTQPLRDLKLKINENIIDLQDNVFIKIKMQKDEEINQRLTIIFENQKVEEFDKTNPFSAKNDMLRHNSKDSGLGSEIKQLNIDADSLNPFTDDDVESCSSLLSSCNEVLVNDLEQSDLTKVATL